MQKTVLAPLPMLIWLPDAVNLRRHKAGSEGQGLHAPLAECTKKAGTTNDNNSGSHCARPSPQQRVRHGATASGTPCRQQVHSAQKAVYLVERGGFPTPIHRRCNSAQSIPGVSMHVATAHAPGPFSCTESRCSPVLMASCSWGREADKTSMAQGTTNNITTFIDTRSRSPPTPPHPLCPSNRAMLAACSALEGSSQSRPFFSFPAST